MSLDPDVIQGRLKHWRGVQTWGIKSQDAKRIAAMTGPLLRAELPVEPAGLDTHPWLLNLPNGTLELQAGRLRSHRRADMLTALCPVPYDATAACPQWEQTLAGVFAGDDAVIGFVRRFFGLCLTGDVREKVLPVFWGDGDNGKSLVVNTVLAVLGPDYGLSLTSEFLMRHRGERHPTENASLFGKRLAVASESQRTDKLNEGLIKRLTGGDPVTARRIREDFWTFDPTHKLILLTNHKPGVSDGGDPAIWSRLKLVPFNQRFWDPDKPPRPGEERPLHLRADKGLKMALVAEYPGILNWLVRGCQEWQRDGLKVPDAVARATAAYQDEQNVVLQFVAERCAVGDHEFKVRAAELYASFMAWPKGTGETDQMKATEFNAQIVKLCGVKKYTNNGT